MDQNHASFQDDLAAYALGALDPDAAASLEAHLQTCESCRTELAEFRSVSSGLLAALPARAPGASVRRNLQQQLAGQARRAQPRFGFSFGQALVAGLMVALVGLNALLVSQVYAVRQEQAELLNDRKSEQSAIAMLAYPSTQTLAFNE